MIRYAFFYFRCIHDNFKSPKEKYAKPLESINFTSLYKRRAMPQPERKLTSSEISQLGREAALRSRRAHALTMRFAIKQKPIQKTPESEEVDSSSESISDELISEPSEDEDDLYEDELDQYGILNTQTPEGTVPVIPAYVYGRINPCITAIQSEDYSILDSPLADCVIVGDFQFLSKVVTYSSPRKSLYTLIRLLFPYIPLHYSTFLRRTVTILQPRNRTDLCEICHTHEIRLAEAQKKIINLNDEPHHSLEKSFNIHISTAHEQRTTMKQQKASLGVDDAMIIMDYKESIKLPLLRDQEGRDFYNRFQISCLTFLVFQRKPDTSLSKTAITFLSEDTRHTGQFTLHCIHSLFQNALFEGTKNISFWSDGGPHFKCREVVGNLLEGSVCKERAISCTINFFAPHHGKSEVDGVFGFFAHLLQDWLPRRGIRDLPSLLTFFQSATRIIKLSSNYPQTQYQFYRFVLVIVFISTVV